MLSESINNETPVLKKSINSVTAVLVLEIAVFLGLVALLSRDISGLDGLFIIFILLIPGLQVLGLVGLVVSIISISKKKRVGLSVILIIISLIFFSGLSFSGAGQIARQITGQVKIEREQEVQHQKELEEYDRETAEWIKYKEDLDKINTAHYEYYKKLFSTQMVFNKFSSGGLLSDRILARFSGLNLLMLDCPKCYVVQTDNGKVYTAGTKQGMLYELQKSMIDSLIGKPLTVSLPPYEDFKEDYQTALDFGLQNAGFNKLESNYVNRPIEYYFDPEIIFKNNSYIAVPAVFYYEGRNINEDLKKATENFESTYKP
jgi:hypothetical protein